MVLPRELIPLYIPIKIFAFIISAICRTCPIHFILLNLIIPIILKSPCHEGISEVAGCITTCVINLGTNSSQLWVSRSTHFTAGEKSPQYALGRELGGPTASLAVVLKRCSMHWAENWEGPTASLAVVLQRCSMHWAENWEGPTTSLAVVVKRRNMHWAETGWAPQPVWQWC